jgi:6-phosphogluconolactonase
MPINPDVRTPGRILSVRSGVFHCLFLFTMGALVDRAAQPTHADEPLVFISSFAAGAEGAIQSLRLDLETGTLKPVQRTGGAENPFFMALSPNRKYLYSIHAKQFGSKDSEEIAAWEIADRDGRLRPINRQSARGSAACYLDVDRTGKSIVVANYTTGSIASLPIGEDGKLGEVVSFVQHMGSSVDPARQKEPHAHCTVISPDNRFVLSADLGIDQVLLYRLDPKSAQLTPASPPFVKTPAGAGPRHLTFHPNGKRVYVVNELSNSVTHFDYEPESAVLSEKQTIPTLPKDFEGRSNCADVKITPDGRFLFATNRGHDSIAAYRIGDDGRLSLTEIEPSLGKGPQNLAIAPGGKLLLCANMPGNNVAVFHIDPQSGKLSPTGPVLNLASPSCILFMP